MTQKTGWTGFKWPFSRIDLSSKYRLGLYNDTTYEQVLHFRLSGKGVIIALAVSTVLLIVFTTLLIAFTPIRELIPGYPNSQMRQNIRQNAVLADSLHQVVKQWQVFLDNSNRIARGENPNMIQSAVDSSLVDKSLHDIKSAEDSLMRLWLEEAEQFNIDGTRARTINKGLAGLHFFPPIKGIISTQFDSKSKKMGIIIETSPNELVMATLDGTVILAGWTIEMGNVLQIQHDDNLISVYKHTSKLLQKQGNRVKAGDVVAVAGSGSNADKGELEFELWHRGVALNPELYIVF